MMRLPLSKPQIQKLLIALGVAILISALTGWLALNLGMDNNWDLLNYHYYNPYAFLNGRMDIDIAPAQLQSYFNPLPDLPFYWMAQIFTARGVGFLLGFVQGINITLALAIFWLAVRQIPLKLKAALGGLVVVGAIFSPSFLGTLGTTFNDNLASLFILAGLVVIVYAHQAERSRKFMLSTDLIAGALIGMALGLKQVTLPYAAGAAVGLLLIGPTRRDRFFSFVIFGIGLAAGALATGGFWWWELWQRFQNPFFPLYNNLFKSASVGSIDLLNSVWYTPKNFWEALVWPAIIARDPKRVNEVTFSDIRLLIVYFLLLFWLVVALIKRRRPSTQAEEIAPRIGLFIVSFFWVSYLAWMLLFSVYRYLVVLDVLIPVVILILVAWLFKTNEARLAVVALASVLILAIFKAPDWGRIDWTDRFVEAPSSSMSISQNSLVVFIGGSPLSFVIPSLPAESRYIRPQGNMRLTETDTFYKEITDEIKDHDGPIYVIYSSYDSFVLDSDILKKLGLKKEFNKCVPLKQTRLPVLMLCRTRHEDVKAQESQP